MLPVFIAALRSGRRARSAGSRPTSGPVATVTASENSSTCRSSRGVNVIGSASDGEPAQHVDADVGDDDAGEAAEQREHQVLGQHLTHQPAAAGAERRTHGQLLLAMAAAREQQVGDVGARDQQHQRHGAEQDHHRRPRHAADDLGHRLHDRRSTSA